MILLADGGSTKVEWALLDQKGNQTLSLYTKGANPFFRDTNDIAAELKEMLLPHLAGKEISKVHFFGAGCANPEVNQVIEQAILKILPETEVEVGSDLLAAAKSLCGKEPGIACILGTGSNSCFYDGKEIVNNVSPLGYILGDEGSGAVLGKILVGALLKDQLGEELKQKFLTQYDLTPAMIIQKVYKEPLPNKFLAKLSMFLKENIENEKIHKLVVNAFVEFFQKNITHYDYQNYPVNFTGSVAYHYRAQLEEAAQIKGIKIGCITKAPMEGLIKYYL